MSMPGLDAVGRPVVGQILVGAATAIVPVLSDPTQEQPQLRGRRDSGYRVALAASGEFRVILPIIPSFGWFAPLGLPTTRPKLPTKQQQAVTFNPQPFVSFGWFEELSKPRTLEKRGLWASLQQFFAYQPNPTTVTPFAWFAPLHDPVRIKPGLRSSLQQFLTTDTAVIPITRLIAWFDWLSDPVRVKPGLRAALQQFLAAPPRLLPTPALSGVLDATETKDTMLAGAMVFNRPTDAEIGVINTTPQPAEIGLFPAAPAAGVITVRISITMP